MPRIDPAEQSRSRRERILDAAFSAFAKRGYRDTAVDDIASAAETSKGGIYFHFPSKEAIFRELMQTTADKLVARVERAVALEREPVAKAEAALRTVLATFAGHRTMARVLFLDMAGAGRAFQAETNRLHERFAELIKGYLDEAVAAGAIPPLDTGITSVVWFGALNEVVARWLLADRPGSLEESYPALREVLLRSAGVPEARIAQGGAAQGVAAHGAAAQGGAGAAAQGGATKGAAAQGGATKGAAVQGGATKGAAPR